MLEAVYEVSDRYGQRFLDWLQMSGVHGVGVEPGVKGKTGGPMSDFQILLIATLFGGGFSVWAGWMLGEPIIQMFRKAQHGAGMTRGGDNMKQLILSLWSFLRNKQDSTPDTEPVPPCEEWQDTGGDFGACREWIATQSHWEDPRHSQGML